LFQRIVEASGLSRLFAEGMIANCCRKAGVSPASITSENLPRVLDEVEKAVRMFKPDDADRLMSNMRAIR
jgi:hypothetical protein